MRTGQSTIQQTLMPEAAAVLSRSAAEAARRCHSQTTPIHVAATLLACPLGLLRRACARSHPVAASHRLQCRALELCFSVALDRIPSGSDGAGEGSVREPPISNALMAALKRAQAHQRRGCPENQQQPLLAVKVELEPLVVSILDDPSVSRVMREAGFSSPAVKAIIEQSMTSTSTATVATFSPATTPNTVSFGRPTPFAALGPRPSPVVPTPLLLSNRNLYTTSCLHHNQFADVGPPVAEDDVEKVLGILRRSKKSNPVLVGDPEPGGLLTEILQRIGDKRGLDSGGTLTNIQVVSFDNELASEMSQLVNKINKLANSIEKHLRNSNVLVNLGDLKWLVEPPAPSSCGQAQQHLVPENARGAVAEIGRLIQRFEGAGAGSEAGRRVWLIGIASCATYLRCQVYHPIMENDWNLQAVPTAPRMTAPTIFPRTAISEIFSKSDESLAPKRALSLQAANSFPSMLLNDSCNAYRRAMCPVCTDSYQGELSKLTASRLERPNQLEKLPPGLPQWLHAAKQSNPVDDVQRKERETRLKESADLLQRWTDTCSRLHPNSSGLLHQQFQLIPATSVGFGSPRMNDHPWRSSPSSAGHHVIPHHQGCQVPTDLGLGQPKPLQTKSADKDYPQRINNPDSCVLNNILFTEKQERQNRDAEDSENELLKRLLKGLSERVTWQQEAASAVAVTVMRSKSGRRRRMDYGNKADTWLLFAGPDKLGKRKMATALSELIFGNHSGPLIFSLVDGALQEPVGDGDCSITFRGKTVLDRVVESVRRNPFSVFVLEDVDQADVVVQGMLRRAMERGRLHDSHGREVSLGCAIFIMTTVLLQGTTKAISTDSYSHSDEEPNAVAKSSSVSVREKSSKHHAEWQQEEHRPTKTRKDLRSRHCLDLNLTIGIGMVDEVAGEEVSPNSSDITCEHEQNPEYSRHAISWSSPTVLTELVNAADDVIEFKPVDFCPLQRSILDAISRSRSSVICDS